MAARERAPKALASERPCGARRFLALVPQEADGFEYFTSLI